jgi:hypothetical protein
MFIKIVKKSLFEVVYLILFGLWHPVNMICSLRLSKKSLVMVVCLDFGTLIAAENRPKR